MLIAYRLLLGLAAYLGYRLTRAVPRYRFVARTLATFLGCELARVILALPRAGAPVPYTGFYRLLFHVDEALVLAFPALSVALPLRVFRAVRPWPVVGTVAGVWLALVWTYPRLRGAWLVEVDTAVIALGALFEAALVVDALWRRTHLAPTERACVLLAAGDVSALVGPLLGDPVGHWPIWRLQGLLVLGTLCALEARWISARRPAGGFWAWPASSR